MSAPIPAKAGHLNAWTLTPWMKAALNELGQREVTGAASNPRILQYRKISGLNLPGDDGAVPWCAIFVNAMLKLGNAPMSGSAMARSFKSANFVPLSAPMVGCVTVISSSRGPASGHVFFYTGEDGLFFQGLGGNQNDEVNISMFPKKKLVGHFWPKGMPLPGAPFDKPVRLARPLLPHEKKVSDA